MLAYKLFIEIIEKKKNLLRFSFNSSFLYSIFVCSSFFFKVSKIHESNVRKKS